MKIKSSTVWIAYFIVQVAGVEFEAGLVDRGIKG